MTTSTIDQPHEQAQPTSDRAATPPRPKRPAPTQSSQPEYTVEDARAAAKQWGWVLAGGVATVIVGIAILSVRWTLGDLAVFTGIVFIVRGIADMATSRASISPALAIVRGVLGLVIGIMALSWPAPTLFVLATITGAWLVAWGIFAVIASLIERGPLWGLTVVAGVLAVPLGVWALGHPGVTLGVVIAVVGIWAVAAGFTYIALSLELRRLPDALDRRSAA
ncbi:MAG: DUF308 domain-containing protein [Actinomycetota bacterium]